MVTGLPILGSIGIHCRVTQRIAVPMISGMVSSTLLVLIVIPTTFALVEGTRLRTTRAHGKLALATHPT